MMNRRSLLRLLGLASLAPGLPDALAAEPAPIPEPEEELPGPLHEKLRDAARTFERLRGVEPHYFECSAQTLVDLFAEVGVRGGIDPFRDGDLTLYEVMGMKWVRPVYAPGRLAVERPWGTFLVMREPYERLDRDILLARLRLAVRKVHAESGEWPNIVGCTPGTWVALNDGRRPKVLDLQVRVGTVSFAHGPEPREHAVTHRVSLRWAPIGALEEGAFRVSRIDNLFRS